MRQPLRHAVMACAIIAGAAPEAMADFQLQPSPVLPSESAQVPLDKAFPGADQGNEPARPAALRHPVSPAPPRFRSAAGFGQGVPLSFAARQIVPPAMAVKFGPGVDPESSVDWIGGRQWNRVLAAAIAPLGLRLTVGATSALISR